MRKILLFLVIACQICGVAAQQKPKWLDKQQKAVVKISIFDHNDKEMSTVTGFFISNDGTLLTSYAPFKGAAKAVVKDVNNKEYPVKYVVAANELYDVLKLKVADANKITALTMAQAAPAVGTDLYLMPYPVLKVQLFTAGKVSEVSKLTGPYNYYKTSIPLKEGQVNAPVMNADGELVGISQDDAAGNKEVSYILPASYAESLKMNAADVIGSTYTSLGIQKAWPESEEQAQISLYLLSSTQNAQTYLNTLNDFIETFPNSPDGYLKRASHYAYQRTALASSESEQQSYLSKALDDIQTAGKYGKDKGEALYNKANLIFGVASADTTIKDPEWTIANAEKIAKEAIDASDLPAYRQLEGDIFYTEGKFAEAFADYQKVNASDVASATSYYMAAKANAAMPGSNFGDQLALLDSAVVKSGNGAESAPYILERIQIRLKLMQYAEAVKDYDLYYKVLNGDVSDGFYYYREQAKFLGNDLDGALADIQSAINQNPNNPTYLAEEAAVYVRKEKYEDALKSIDSALKQAPDFAACYRLRGVCYVRLHKKDPACEALKKAQELGDKVAEKLIKENCN